MPKVINGDHFMIARNSQCFLIVGDWKVADPTGLQG